MPNPSPSSAISRTLDIGASLEQFDLEANQLGFIGLKVCPHLNVSISAASYGRIPIKQLLKVQDTKRAADGSYNMGNWEFEPVSYATKENGFSQPVDERNAKIYRNFFDAEVVAAKLARDIVLRNFEARIAALIFNTGTWTGSSLTTAAGTAWSTHASATPIANVYAARIKVYTNSGLVPNAVVMDYSAYEHAIQCAEVIDRIKYSGRDDPKNINAVMLAQCFGVDQVLVAGAIKNTANEGQAASLSSVWTNTMAMVCRVGRTSGDAANIVEPCIGRTFHYTEDGSDIGGVMESYFDDSRRSNIMRARMDTDEKVVYTEAGHLLTGVL